MKPKGAKENGKNKFPFNLKAYVILVLRFVFTNFTSVIQNDLY